MNKPFEAIPDIQSTIDDRHIAIQRVGIKGLRYPLNVRLRDGSIHPRPRLVRVPPPIGLQAPVAGGWLIAVPPQNTSRTCPCCGHVSAANRQTQARFACVECGFEDNADVVGAINILSRGMDMLRDEGQDTAHACVGRESAARIACEVSGAAMPPAAGTHRSDCLGETHA